MLAPIQNWPYQAPPAAEVARFEAPIALNIADLVADFVK